MRTKYLTDAAWLQSDDDQYELVYFLIRLQGDWVKPTALKRYYGGFIYSSDYLKELAALSDGKINEADASELITTDMMITGADEEPGEAQTIALAVMVPEGISSEDVIETTEKAFFKYKETVDEQVGDHTLRFDQEDIRNRYDQSPVGRRRDVLYEIYNLKAQMKATVDTFSSKQRMLFEKMTGSITEEELTTVSTSTTKGYGKGVFLAGAVLAVFLYFCLMILRSLIRSRIHTKKELTGVPYLGEVRSYHARNIADAFITHCGMNSASEGLYFGVPLVLFPQTPEQGAVARRTEELGAGVRLNSISEDDILNALDKVLSDPQFKAKAGKVSESFKACRGAEEAKAFLEQIAAQ